MSKPQKEKGRRTKTDRLDGEDTRFRHRSGLPRVRGFVLFDGDSWVVARAFVDRHEEFGRAAGSLLDLQLTGNPLEHDTCRSELASDGQREEDKRQLAVYQQCVESVGPEFHTRRETLEIANALGVSQETPCVAFVLSRHPSDVLAILRLELRWFDTPLTTDVFSREFKSFLCGDDFRAGIVAVLNDADSEKLVSTIDRFVRQVRILTASLARESKRRRDLRVFLPSSSASWSRLQVTLTAEGLVVEEGERREAFSRAEAGFESEAGKPLKAWDLLCLFASRGGRLRVDDPGFPEHSLLKQRVSELRRALKRFFQQTSDPFHPTARGLYRTRFQVVSYDGLQLHIPDGMGWLHIRIRRIDDQRVRIEIPRVDRIRGGGGFNRDGGRGREAEAAASLGELSLDVRLVQLGLAHADDTPTGAGRAFGELLANRGSIVRPSDDEPMLELIMRLQAVFGLQACPFDYRPREGWRAEFEVPAV